MCRPLAAIGKRVLGWRRTKVGCDLPDDPPKRERTKASTRIIRLRRTTERMHTLSRGMPCEARTADDVSLTNGRPMSTLISYSR